MEKQGREKTGKEEEIPSPSSFLGILTGISQSNKDDEMSSKAKRGKSISREMCEEMNKDLDEVKTRNEKYVILFTYMAKKIVDYHKKVDDILLKKGNKKGDTNKCAPISSAKKKSNTKNDDKKGSSKNVNKKSSSKNLNKNDCSCCRKQKDKLGLSSVQQPSKMETDQDDDDDDDDITNQGAYGIKCEENKKDEGGDGQKLSKHNFSFSFPNNHQLQTRDFEGVDIKNYLSDLLSSCQEFPKF